MTETLYLVSGLDCNEWDDDSWGICFYRNKADADKHVELAERLSDLVRQRHVGQQSPYDTHFVPAGALRAYIVEAIDVHETVPEFPEPLQ